MGSSDLCRRQALRSGVMGDTVEDVAGQLRKLAVELVRAGRAAESTAVLVGIGAIEMLQTFAGDSANTSPNPQSAHSPGY